MRIYDWIKGGILVASPMDTEVIAEKAFSKPSYASDRVWPLNFNWKTEPLPKQLETEKELYPKDVWALFGEMGVGKSKIALDIGSALIAEGQIDGIVIISRVALRENWIRELNQHGALDLNAQTLESKKSSVKKVRAIQPPFLVSSGVESYSGQLYKGQVFEVTQEIVKNNRCMLIVDEAHSIKGHKSNRTRNMLALSGYCKHKAIMTGTPTPKDILDLYCQFQFLDPDILSYPSHYTFKLAHTILGGFGGKEILGYRGVDEVMEAISPYTVRLYRNDVVELPPIIRKPITVKMSKPMAEAYRKMKREHELEINDQMISVMEAISVYLRLRGLSSGYISDEDKNIQWVVDPAKVPKMIELKSIIDNTIEKGIVWVHTHAELEAVSNALGDLVIPYHGHLKIEEREANLERFRESPDGWLVATVQSMQLGLTLTEATMEIFYSLPLSYSDFSQAEARSYRIGQDKSVMVLLMVTEGTIDMDIMAAILEKKDVHDYIMEKPVGERFLDGEMR
jgi:SNF2 family DNA or RNA helicase